jgi:hypothetical protein
VQISRLTTRRIFSASSTGIRPQKETLAMTASDRFTDLREQVERAEREVRAAAAETRAAVDVRLDDARRRADDLTAGMRERAREDADQADAHWQALHRSWDEHVQRVRRRIDEHDTAVDLGWAQRDAAVAEADALDAIAFAASSIGEAEYAVLDALRARGEADALAASSSPSTTR